MHFPSFMPVVRRFRGSRLSSSLSGGSPTGGTRDIWLCHTLCELGATRMVDLLTTIRRFLELNPDQVIILFDEDYVTERDLKSAFQRAGLVRRLATLQPGQPLPTLGDLIRSGRNLVVFAQNPPSGNSPWDPYAFSWIQDTPLGATKPSQFTCKLNRGAPTNPLLMINNWADIFPPRPTPNLPLVKRAFILARARQMHPTTGTDPQPNPHRLLQPRRRTRGRSDTQRRGKPAARRDHPAQPDPIESAAEHVTWGTQTFGSSGIALGT